MEAPVTGSVVHVNGGRYMVCDGAFVTLKQPEPGYVFIVALDDNAGRLFQYPIALFIKDEQGKRLTAEEIGAYESLGIIQAIKLVRDRTGMGLKDSKDFVEAEAMRLNLQRPKRV